jgi:outer membrane protein insertion porin family
MFKKIFKINLILLFFTTLSLAEIIKEVKVNGNKRISSESIVVFGDIILNTEYNDERLNAIFKKIYDTKFFKNISLEIKNSILNITVTENPIIEDIQIIGIPSKKLTTLLYDKIKLKNRNSFIDTIFLADLNLIKNLIKNNGYYFSEIKTSSILNEEQNSIRLTYDIDLGEKAKIGEIQFIGDKKIKDKKLKGIITTEESKFWKFISQTKYLNAERLALDKRLLVNYYKNNGYYNVDVTNSFVEFSNNSFKLIFNIDAGNQFKFKNLNLVLADDYDKKYFQDILQSLDKLKDQVYSLNKIEKVLLEVDKIALTRQYQFIDAILDEKIVGNDKINVEISLQDNEKFYVEKINIYGNDYTIEEVIRNVLVVDEGDPFNEILFNKSINNIKAKNIFSKVESEIVPGSNKNLKVVNLTVEEKPTGEISLGAGFGTSGGTAGGGVRENNFLGKGIKLDTNILVSANSVKGRFVYERPNFNYTDNSLFTSIKSETIDNIANFGYKTSDVGITLGTAFEQFENLYFRPEIDISHEKLQTTSTASSTLKQQKGNYFDIYFNYSLDYDLRNSGYRPEDGYVNSFNQELPLVSNNYELFNSFETTSYKKISETVTKISFYAGVINSLGSSDVRISKRLFMPPSKLRGFEAGKIGPVENFDYIGGNYVSALNMSASFPQFFSSLQNLDFSIFFDAGNIWGVDYNSSIDNSKIRSSTGVTLDVLTPMGPLNFSLSQPLTKSSTDITETFRFNLGTTF